MTIKTKLIIYSIYTLMGFGLISCGPSSGKKGTARPPINLRVEGLIASKIPLSEEIEVSGTIKAFDETVLMPELAGRIVSINLPEGKFVVKGTLLVKLFDGDYQAQLKKAQAQLELAKLNQKRLGELIKVNGVSQADYDQVELQVKSYTADCDLLNVMIKKTEVLAPFDGIIGLKNVSVGAQVSTSTAIATIRAENQLKLDFSVPEKYGSYFTSGMKVKFTVQASENKNTAVVLGTEAGIDAATRNLKIRALIEGNLTGLIPGAFANVHLQVNENKSALMVPTEAIIPQAQKKIVIISVHGKAKFVPVVTGIRTASKVEVVKGLKTGDTIVTSGILFIKADDVIKFSKVKRDTI